MNHITPHFKGKEFMLRMLTRPSNDNSNHRIMRNQTNFLISGLDLNEFNLAIRKYHSIQMHVCISKLITHLNLKIFYDIGANIGAVSLPIINKNKKLYGYLFEPSPHVLAKLITNVYLNKSLVNRTYLYDCALGNLSQVNRFYPSNEETNSGVGDHTLTITEIMILDYLKNFSKLMI